MLCFLAQTLPSSGGDLGGYSGWAGAGLLGLVLSWLLFKHLPDKDRQIKDLISSKDEHIERMVIGFTNEIRDTRREYAASIEKEREVRHLERTALHEDSLKMAVLFSENTQETRALAQETRALAGSIGNLVERIEKANKS